MGQFTARLKKMQATWDDERKRGEEGSAFTPVPAGTYHLKLQKAALQEMGQGTLMLAREHLVMEGEHEGEVVFDTINMDQDFGREQAAGFVNQMGFDNPDKIADIEDTLEEIQEAAPEYKGRVTFNKGGFARVTIQEVFDSEGDEPSETEPDVVPEVDDASEDLRQRLLTFAADSSLGDVTDDLDLETIIKTIGEYELKEDAFNADELALLIEAGLEGKIIKEKKATLKRTIAKKKGKR